MIIEYEGTSYEFDFEDVTVKQAMKIEKHLGSTLTQWGDRLKKGSDWAALQVLGWLILFDGKGAIDDTDFKLVKLGKAFELAVLSEVEAEAAAQAAERPTVAGPSSRRGGARRRTRPTSRESRSRGHATSSRV